MYGLNRYIGSGCYRFLDTKKKVIYIGSAKNIDRRLHSHFCGKRGHLSRECYDSVAKIEVTKTKDYASALALEQYLINKYKPKYNKRDKERSINSKVVVNEKLYEGIERWKLYHQIKPFEEDNKLNTSKFNIVIAVAYVIVIIIFLIQK